MAIATLPETHYGVYALIRVKNQFVAVKKMRGPYKGLYDLVGGVPINGETKEVALAREVKEEIGAEITSIGKQWKRFDLRMKKDSLNLPFFFRHIGDYIDALVDKIDFSIREIEDVEKPLLIDIQTISIVDLSPPLLWVLKSEGILL